ncbi:MAG: hypothetical protein ABL940_07290, partial [Bacteroidia bacterium]
MTLSELLCKADYGAIGNIVKLDNNYFYLKVEQYVLNELSIDTLVIKRFENWTCRYRKESYKLGQKELVFFKKSNYVVKEFEFLGYGAGDEYELPIINDTVKYRT